MKKSRPVYLLLLLFLLFQGNHFVFAKAQVALHDQVTVETLRFNKLQTIDRDQQKEFAYDFVMFSESNDDDDNLSARKKTFTSRFYESSAGVTSMTALSGISFSPHFINHSVYLPHYKYIFQRTLRV